MTVLLHFLLNVLLLIGSFIPFVVAVYLAFIRTPHPLERVIRGLALFAATLAVLGADAAGLTLGSFTVHQLVHHGAAGFAIKIFLAVLFGLAGIGSAIYLITKLQKSTNIAIRVIVFIGMLAHVELLDIYINAVKLDGFSVGPAAIPGVSFIVGMLLYVVFNYDPDRSGGGSAAGLRRLFAREAQQPAGRVTGKEQPPDPSQYPNIF